MITNKNTNAIFPFFHWQQYETKRSILNKYGRKHELVNIPEKIKLWPIETDLKLTLTSDNFNEANYFIFDVDFEKIFNHKLFLDLRTNSGLRISETYESIPSELEIIAAKSLAFDTFKYSACLSVDFYMNGENEFIPYINMNIDREFRQENLMFLEKRLFSVLNMIACINLWNFESLQMEQILQNLVHTFNKGYQIYTERKKSELYNLNKQIFNMQNNLNKLAINLHHLKVQTQK
jgi:hypothetical protein